MTDTNAYMQRLVESNPLREPLLRSVIQAIRLPKGSRGLGAGCGIGLQALLLAEAIGPTGHVTSLDLSPAFLRYAQEVVKEFELSDRISFQEGDVSKLPFDDDIFNWVWCVDCVGYPVGDSLPLLRELARVEKPDGPVAILGWSSQLSDDIRRALMSLFQMLWGEAQPEVSQEDWAEYQRLCQPESPEFILNLSDYYAFFTYTMFRGKVPA
ncbi:class I SAM-dependent methyltransferase [Thermodesulfobacteriota bacterium]